MHMLYTYTVGPQLIASRFSICGLILGILVHWYPKNEKLFAYGPSHLFRCLNVVVMCNVDSSLSTVSTLLQIFSCMYFRMLLAPCETFLSFQHSVSFLQPVPDGSSELHNSVVWCVVIFSSLASKHILLNVVFYGASLLVAV
jgi:hypothetical protein